MQSQSFTGAGAWQALVFDMASLANFSGTVKNLRLDPIGVATSFEIDWIRASDGDADDDGVPDGDEFAGDADADGLQNYLDPDSDNDSQSDLLEFLSGSDKLSAGSRFTLQTSTPTNGGEFHIDFPVIPLRLYTLEKWSEASGVLGESTHAGPFEAASVHRMSIPISSDRGIFRVRIGLSPAVPAP